MAWLKKIFIDENKRESITHFPFFTAVVTIIEIALVIYTIVYNGGLVSMTDNPMAGPSTLTLIRNGAKFVPCMKSTPEVSLKYIITCPSALSSANKTCTYEEFLWYACNVEKLTGFPYQVYRFFVPIFLHSGIIHLIISVGYQLMLGIQLERKFGSIRIVIIYMVSGIGSVLLSAVVLSQYATVGASGALYGLLSVNLMDTIRSWKDLSKPWIPVTINVIGAITSLIIGFFVPSIDYMAHIGGFLVGILIGLLICPNLHWSFRRNIDPVKSRLVIMCISFVFLLVFFLGGFIGFFRTDTPIIYSTN